MAGWDFKPRQSDSKSCYSQPLGFVFLPEIVLFVREQGGVPIFIHYSFCRTCCQRNQISRFGSHDSWERLLLRRHLPASFSSSLPIWRMTADTSSHRWDDRNERSKLQTWDSAVLIIIPDWKCGRGSGKLGEGGVGLRREGRIHVWPFTGERKKNWNNGYHR